MKRYVTQSISILSYLLCCMVLLIVLTYHDSDPTFLYTTTGPIHYKNIGGWCGAQLMGLLLYCIGGLGTYLLLLYVCAITFTRVKISLRDLLFFGFLITVGAATVPFDLYPVYSPGGVFGLLIYRFLNIFFSRIALLIIICTLFFIYIFIVHRKNIYKNIYMIYQFFTPDTIIESVAASSSVAQDSHTAHMHKLYTDIAQEINTVVPDHVVTGYKKPNMSMYRELGFNTEKSSIDHYRAHGAEQARVLAHKLSHFGITGTIRDIRVGPVVTLFVYEPNITIRVNKIIALQDDIALALQVPSVRILAPLPHTNAVGIEVPHPHRDIVYWEHCVAEGQLEKSPAVIPIMMGVDTIGVPVVFDLSRAPHLLIAGSTGSGKSMGVHSIIMSILTARTPDDVKLILIDPKRLECSLYTDIPHLVFPIATTVTETLAALTWAVNTMQERYAQLAQWGVRSITECDPARGHHSYPSIVIIIDELADLMMQSGPEIERLLVRLAQMARAAGIHVVCATQRPSVDVITGLIKVNFPSRIAFRVTSPVDSRTIIDTPGAEKLLGSGDLLFLDGTRGTLSRLQGAYTSDSLREYIVEHVRLQRTVEYQELPPIPTATDELRENDEILYTEVIQWLATIDDVSISLLQRRFGVGYNRAARIIELLEQRGRIMQVVGGKSRRVIK